ncbi:MAG TPA: hypothetical protein VEA99_05005 [Gemmatimonadaceae bacterium]|nr:hypothetical protein [Gemmatimonadaceae bacterium]
MSRSTAGAMRAAVTLIALVAAVGAPSRGDAQIFKKLKDAAASKAAEKLGEKAVDKAAEKAGIEQAGSERAGERELLGMPLTADTLDLVLKGLGAMAASMEERDRVQQRMIAAGNRAGELRGSATVERWQERERLIGRCQDEVIDQRHEQQQKEMQAKVQANPAKYQAEVMKMAQEMAPLQAKGDMEGAQKVQLAYMARMTGFDPKQDTVAAQAKCGTIPPKPRELAQIDSLDGLAKKLGVEVRALEATASAKGAAAAGGMSEQRFAQARERILTWFYDGAREKYRFPETPLLVSRKADIERVKAAF